MKVDLKGAEVKNFRKIAKSPKDGCFKDLVDARALLIKKVKDDFNDGVFD